MPPAYLFEAFIAALIAFPVTAISTLGVISLMKELRLGQFIRSWGPKLHEHKSGTPTMGGLGILLGLGIAGGYIWFSLPSTRNLLLLLFVSTFGFGLLGALDDVLSLFRGKSMGLLPRQKLAGQVAFSLLFIHLSFHLLDKPRLISLPFTGVEFLMPVYAFYAFAVVVLVGTVNAVNLTDGLDGLAAGASLITLLAFCLVLPVAALPIVIALVAGIAGFAPNNFYPARVFMGDTGAFALGGFIGGLAVISRTELLLPFFGGLFFCEVLSVSAQVSYYKLTGGRIFKITPFHHHFESATGIDYDYLLPNVEWPESLITTRLLVFHGLLAGFGLFAFYYLR
ncbi:phospho-N-acetylmuramoyl-pentapeptide-transferase [Candidatus Bipolaricaulota bacterium]|nr:phospho-N-acetylmuramoyl-pentapeptide-transferase [Candidatus Bipolaricaulota bacterium]